MAMFGCDNDRQVLELNNERFCVPEVLFKPSTAGVHQRSVSETVVEAIEACDVRHRSLMFANILLVGGNANMPGFAERLLRSNTTHDLHNHNNITHIAFSTIYHTHYNISHTLHNTISHCLFNYIAKIYHNKYNIYNLSHTLPRCIHPRLI
eukprot:c21580_g1_i1.p1 GENE.c21580_g1_i1~~c21580_g1_i1.p1  ORF type:complete len:162 (-),score=25.93 c21580_g1_i1:61-513(-)